MYLRFFPNVMFYMPRHVIHALLNGAPSPQNLLLSNINLSQSVFRQETTFSLPSNSNTIASHENDEADDYINLMT